MQSLCTDPKPAVRTGGWLKLAVHLDALRKSPRLYLTALWWYICGKRFRARARFAPLLALSRRAYWLWLREEDTASVEERYSKNVPPIIALVDVRSGQGNLGATLRSLEAQGIAMVPIGGKDNPTVAQAARKIDWSASPWLMPLSAGDVLARGAAQAYRAVMVGGIDKEGKPETRVIYADDDILDERCRRTAPHFKPAWNRELFSNFDYLSGACAVRAEANELVHLRGPDWAARLVAYAAGQSGPIHIPRVLHHRNSRPQPRVPAPAEVISGDLPPVSVIVPTRNRADLLRTCLEGLASTNYPGIEVIVADNDSDDPETLSYLQGLDRSLYRVVRHPGKFNFSAINNHAAVYASGRLLCLLNNDIEIVQPDWLRLMARQALRDDVGAVGARLLYPDGRIQHAGVVLGIGGGAAHAHRLLQVDEEGYFRRHALPQFVSAVTAACLVVSRDRFNAVGGLDDHNFAVAFNDVDLCMRLNRKGWQSLYEPRATLVHHESVSRGFDRDSAGAARLAGELAALKRLWMTGDKVDPFHHPQLSPFSERFVVRL